MQSESGNLEELPPGLVAAALGGFGLLLGLGGWTGPLAFLRWIDVPVTLLLFLASAWFALRMGRRNLLPFFACLACAAGCVSALAALLLVRGHPWTG